MTAALAALTRAALAAHGIPLAEVVARAGLLARRDRSYLVPAGLFEDFAARLTDPRRSGGPFRVLCVGERRLFSYDSQYFDTPGLRCFHDHRQGRRLRFKVRERLYRDTVERWFEVKLKSGRGETVKHRQRIPPDTRSLARPQCAFLGSVLRQEYGTEPPPLLVPSLRTEYVRVTFAVDGQRVTCDGGLRVSRGGPPDEDGLAADGGLVLVETKTAGHLTEADRLLHRLGVRPADLTKYTCALSALEPSLPAGRWTRTTRRVFPTSLSGTETVPYSFRTGN